MIRLLNFIFCHVFILTGIFDSKYIFGATTVKGGGKVVVCKQNFIEAYDLYKIRRRKNSPIGKDLWPDGILSEHLDDWLNKAANLSECFSDSLKKNTTHILESADIENAEISFHTDDIEYLHIARGCRIEQAAEIKFNAENKNFSVSFDHFLWYRMNPYEQSALVLHEALYANWMSCNLKSLTTTEAHRRRKAGFTADVLQIMLADKPSLRKLNTLDRKYNFNCECRNP